MTSLPAFDYNDLIVEGARRRGTPEQVRIVEEDFAKPVQSDEDLARIAGIILPLYFHKYDDEIGRQIAETTRFSAAAWNRFLSDVLPKWSVLDRLHEIQVPTLVIGTTDDWVTPMEVGAKRIHERLPNSELMVFEHSGHFPFIEEQGRFLQEVGEWIGALPHDVPT
jgi:proline iminopeptidase